MEHIIYRNADNGYTVLNLVSGEAEITCVGIFSAIAEGENIEASGDYTDHPTYGKQFKVESFEEKAPEDEEAIERYLGSGAIRGIGLALAARIVRRFKADTFRIIEEEPERLAEVKGISERKAMEIADQVNEKRDLRQAMIFLQQYGITMNLAVKVYQQYGQEVYGIIRENPYRLADDIEGVGFRTADEIAVRVGIRMDSDFRIRSGILYVLLQASTEGHTYLPEEELTRRTGQLLEVGEEQIEKQYMDLAIERKIIMKQGENQTQIYAASFYYMEANTATMLKQLNVSYDVPDLEIEERVRRIEKQTGMELDEHQMTAVKEAVRNGLLIITGGPGTGKTTTINTIIKYFEMEGLDIFLAAPTGRAAKRMSETTGFEARTIHRMLELNGGVDGAAGFERNEQNPLETDVVIIDEMSMVDSCLFEAVLRAISVTCKLVLVGDSDQLPSVGAGNVLKDIIDSGVMSVVTLKEIFRQAQESEIVMNAHKIVNGEHIDLASKDKDFFFMQRLEYGELQDLVVELCKTRLPKAYDYSPIDDIQVLSPTRKGPAGTVELNKRLQQELNPPAAGKSEVKTPVYTFRKGDKVMQTKNDYEILWKKYITEDKTESGAGIFNGDIGIIIAVNKILKTVTIDFEGRIAVYDKQMLDNLELAYAITVHKSQGSEFDVVILTVFGGFDKLYYRNLLYTAVTRAKRMLIIVGSKKRVDFMIDNNKRTLRYTALKNMLMELVEGDDSGQQTLDI